MPKATVSSEHQRFPLASCQGGFVLLRQLSYAEMMHRRDIASKMYTPFKNRGGKDRIDIEIGDTVNQFMEVANVEIMKYEFAKAIVDHNLEDDSGHKLDFSNEMTFDILDPKIGAEIGRYIDQLNQEDEDNIAPLEKQPTSSLQDSLTQPKGSTAQE